MLHTKSVKKTMRRKVTSTVLA